MKIDSVEALQLTLEKVANFSKQDFEQALETARQSSTSLIGIFEKANILPEDKLLTIMAHYYKVSVVDLANMEISKTVINLIPKEIAQQYRLVPIDRAGNNIVIAIADPRNIPAMDAIRFKVGYFTKPVLASEAKISEAIERYYGKVDLSNLAGSGENSSSAKAAGKARKVIGTWSDKDDGPIIKLVNDVMLQCAAQGASDIHIEPYEEYMRIRLRLDGALLEIARPPVAMKGALISRIKIMAGLNIAETRLPQDGAINIKIGNNPVDFRVNTLPTANGEKIVMRILDKSNLQVDMTQLGFEKEQLSQFKDAISKPHGMVLVTGPTGSGKTTTLYSALQELNREELNVMTAEDPVEYNLSGINQVQMKPDIGLDFAAALRSFLRQDPDIIMVGEIRDLETAEIGVKAALTGHLVLSTLHTNSAPDTISRLLNMGLAPFNLVAALNCITAQRLMRKICSRCKIEDPNVSKEVLYELGIPKSYLDRVKAYVGKGCSACQNSGTKGRIAVHEVLVLKEEVKRSILRGDAALDIKKVAIACGMQTLRQSALSKMAQGIVNAQEVIKTTSADSERKAQA